MKINLKTTLGAITIAAGSSFVAATSASADTIIDSQAQAGEIVAHQETAEPVATPYADETSYNQAIINAINAERAKQGLTAIQQSSTDLQAYADQRNSLDGNTIIAQHSDNDAYMSNVYYGAQSHTNAQGSGAETLMLAVTGSSADEVAANFISSVYETDASGAWNNAHVNMMLNSNIADAAFSVRRDDTYGIGFQVVGLYVLNDEVSSPNQNTTVDQPAPAPEIIMPEVETIPTAISNSTDQVESTNTDFYEQFVPSQEQAPMARDLAHSVEPTLFDSNIDPDAAINTGDAGSQTDLTVTEKTEGESSSSSNNNDAPAPTLPNTGESDQSTLQIIGLGLTTVMAGMIIRRRG